MIHSLQSYAHSNDVTEIDVSVSFEDCSSFDFQISFSYSFH